uniref:CX domain-containing protein n=1 Tax=Parascaris univalens TaxID=6257 RepID=A0A915BE74_PARUN
SISRHTPVMNITVLVLVLTVVCGTLSIQQPPIPFYSSSGGSYVFMSNFSKEESFAKFDQTLFVLNDTNKGTKKRLLPTTGAPFKLWNIEYYVSEKSFSSNEAKNKWMRKCVLNFNQTRAMNDIYLNDGISHVHKIIWTCPAHGWCCGIECCQPYFKSPWPVIGPDAIAVACGIIAFFVCFGALKAMSRLKKLVQGGSDNLKSAQ